MMMVPKKTVLVPLLCCWLMVAQAYLPTTTLPNTASRTRRSGALSSSPSSSQPVVVMSALPITTNKKGGQSVDYSRIVSQAAAATASAIKEGKRLFTIDFPPLEGTTAVKRYEMDREFVLNYLKALGFTNILPIGEEVYIKKTLKAGEYLSQEGLAGYTARSLPNGKTPSSIMNVILNPSLDLTYLKDVQKEYDDRSSPVVLVNCGLEKLTFFDKLSMGGGKYFESFQPIYTLKKVGSNGFLFKPSLDSKWQTHAVLNAPKPYVQLVEETSVRPKYLDVENRLKAAVAQNLQEYQAKAEDTKKMNKMMTKSFPLFE